MIESELAFNANGEPFAVPETASGWRVRRLRGGRGAPELVYAREGGPLVLGMDAGIDELREAVDMSGRYRLDAVDDDGKAVANVPPSYVQITIEPRNTSMPGAPTQTVALASTDHVLGELARASAEMMRRHTELAEKTTELAKTVAMQQPELVKAAAEILRAADGAGLPRREPMADYGDDDSEEDLDAEETQPAQRPAFSLLGIMEQLRPVLTLAGVDVDKLLLSCGVPVMAASKPTASSKSSATSNRRAQGTAQPRTATPSASSPQAPTEPTTEPTADDEHGADEAPPFVAANPLAHLMAIQAQLSPDERATVQRAMSRLTKADLDEWRDRLADTPIEEAVAQIRAEIETLKNKSTEKVS